MGIEVIIISCDFFSVLAVYQLRVLSATITYNNLNNFGIFSSHSKMPEDKKLLGLVQHLIWDQSLNFLQTQEAGAALAAVLKLCCVLASCRELARELEAQAPGRVKLRPFIRSPNSSNSNVIPLF